MSPIGNFSPTTCAGEIRSCLMFWLRSLSESSNVFGSCLQRRQESPLSAKKPNRDGIWRRRAVFNVTSECGQRFDSVCANFRAISFQTSLRVGVTCFRHRNSIQSLKTKSDFTRVTSNFLLWLELQLIFNGSCSFTSMQSDRDWSKLDISGWGKILPASPRCLLWVGQLAERLNSSSLAMIHGRHIILFIQKSQCVVPGIGVWARVGNLPTLLSQLWGKTELWTESVEGDVWAVDTIRLLKKDLVNLLRCLQRKLWLWRQKRMTP